MRRREFIGLLAVATVTRPPAAYAQQPSKLPIIGFLGGTTQASANTWTAAFVQRLSELGWDDGRTVAIQYHWAEGRKDRMAEIAGEFVRSKVDVIFVYGTQASLAAKQATASIPIVFTLPGDPIKTGLVASLARPSGNVTGVSSQTTDLSGKRLELLREIVPGLRRLAIVANDDNPASIEEMHQVQKIARADGLDVLTYEIRRTEDIEPVFASLRGSADALYVTSDALMGYNRVRTIHLRSSHNYRPCMGGGNTWRQLDWFHTGQIFRICSDGLEITLIKFFAERSRANCPLNSRPSSTLSSMW
jgi:putative tryptophan/tyrosine transport system substrate-binding protein